MDKHIIEKPVKMFKCGACDYVWTPVSIAQPPRKCPNCQSRFWKSPRPKAVEEKVNG